MNSGNAVVGCRLDRPWRGDYRHAACAGKACGRRARCDESRGIDGLDELDRRTDRDADQDVGRRRDRKPDRRRARRRLAQCGDRQGAPPGPQVAPLAGKGERATAQEGAAEERTPPSRSKPREKVCASATAHAQRRPTPARRSRPQLASRRTLPAIRRASRCPARRSAMPRIVSVGPGGFLRQGPGEQQAPIPPAPPPPPGARQAERRHRRQDQPARFERAGSAAGRWAIRASPISISAASR